MTYFELLSEILMTKKSENITKKGLSAAKYTVVFRVLAQGISLLATVFLVRTLSEHDYGVYNLLYSVIGLLGMVISFGIANTIQRYMPEYYSRGEFSIAHNLYRIASVIRLFSNVVVLGLVLIAWEQFAPYLKIVEYKVYFVVFTLIILLDMQRYILDNCLNSFFLQKYTQGFSVVFILFKGLGYCTAMLLRMDLWFILSTDLLAYLIIFLLLSIIYYKKVPKAGGKIANFNMIEKKRIFRYALFYNFNDAGVGLLNVDIDNFIIGVYLNPMAIGAYAFCNRVSKMMGRILPISYLIDVIRPAFFVASLEASSEEINKYYQLLFKLIYMFQIPLFIFVLGFADELITLLFQGKFIEWSALLIVVVFFDMLNAFQIPVGLVAQQGERADVFLYSKIFGVYNLIADIVLISYIGIWGAVLATGSATFGKNLFIWFFIRKEASFKGMLPFVTISVLFWLGIYLVGYSIRVILPPGLLSLSAGGVLFIVAFAIQFRVINLNAAEKNILNSLSQHSKKLKVLMRWCNVVTT